MRTAQELYDQIVHHLRVQGCKSQMSNGDLCMYRNPEGLSCAIGCLIPPEEYDPKMEDKGIDGLIDSFLLSKELYDEFNNSYELLYRMQRIHDSIPVEKWETNFRMVAEQLNLKYPSL